MIIRIQLLLLLLLLLSLLLLLLMLHGCCTAWELNSVSPHSNKKFDVEDTPNELLLSQWSRKREAFVDLFNKPLFCDDMNIYWILKRIRNFSRLRNTCSLHYWCPFWVFKRLRSKLFWGMPPIIFEMLLFFWRKAFCSRNMFYLKLILWWRIMSVNLLN